MFKNKDELISHGFRDGREKILKIIGRSIKSVNSYESTSKKVHLDDDTLSMDNYYFDLSKVDNIYVIGGGKATFPIGRALEEILDGRIREGMINVKESKYRKLDLMHVTKAGHPVPDRRGLNGTKNIVKIAKKAGERDIVFCVITGGASALMPFPAEKINLEDLKKINKLLLNSGAPLEDINTVRKHISRTKGGKLAKLIHPAKIVNLILIDEIAGEPWGPTAPDNTTFEDAIKVLKKHNLWRKAPKTIKNYLKKGLKNKNLETPNDSAFEELKIHNIILGNNEIMCEAAQEKAKELNLNPIILTTKLEGEGREAGTVFASVGREVLENNRPMNPPCAIIAAGETPVTIEEKTHGEGGPSQEFVLGASLKISGYDNVVIGSIDTDGTDGPTNIAGGLVDGDTVKRADEKNIDIYENLMEHNSFSVLKELGDAIFTEPTETNVMNLYIMVVL